MGMSGIKNFSWNHVANTCWICWRIHVDVNELCDLRLYTYIICFLTFRNVMFCRKSNFNETVLKFYYKYMQVISSSRRTARVRTGTSFTNRNSKSGQWQFFRAFVRVSTEISRNSQYTLYFINFEEILCTINGGISNDIFQHKSNETHNAAKTLFLNEATEKTRGQQQGKWLQSWSILGTKAKGASKTLRVHQRTSVVTKQSIRTLQSLNGMQAFNEDRLCTGVRQTKWLRWIGRRQKE